MEYEPHTKFLYFLVGRLKMQKEIGEINFNVIFNLAQYIQNTIISA